MSFTPLPLPPDVATLVEETLCGVEEALGVTLTLHDHLGICGDVGSGRGRLPESRHHRHAFCALGREHGNAWDRHCVRHCQYGVNHEMQSGTGAILHDCWKGATELAVPLFRERCHVLTLFAGAFRRPGAKPPAVLSSAPALAAWRELPLLTEAKAALLVRVLTLAGNGLLRLLEGGSNTAAEGDDRGAAIVRFLRNHAHETVRLADLARALHLSPSRARHLVSELCGKPFQELLQEERLRRAAFFLEHSRYRLAEVAARTGFPNEYYFSRVFRQHFGTPPGAYRTRLTTTHHLTA